MEQIGEKLKIEMKQNEVATRVLWISVFLGVICNYFGGSPIKVIIVLLSLGLFVAILFTVISVKKVLVSWAKYIALIGLVVHAILITYVHHALNSVFLLFFNLIFISLFLNVLFIVLTYIANVIMVLGFYAMYGTKMYVGYANMRGMLIILFYMFLACVILCEMVSLIKNLQKVTKNQFVEADENRKVLKNVLDQMSNSVQFLKNFSDQINKEMAEAASASEEMSASFNEVASSAEEQFSITESIHDYIDLNSKHIETIVEDTDELKQLVVNNTQIIENGNNSLQQMTQQNEHLMNIIDETAALMEEFNSQNKNIDEMLVSIENIAKQTNLLSLNANIEAARAGEYGRGFTVVAGEIRNLAENSTKSVNMISQILNSMMIKSNEITGKINNGQEVMNQSRVYNQNTMKVFSEISNFNTIVIKNTDNVHKKITDLNKNSMIVSSQTKEITNSTGNISNAINNIVTGSEVQSQTLQSISKSLYELDNLVSKLRYMTEQAI